MQPWSRRFAACSQCSLLTTRSHGVRARPSPSVCVRRSGHARSSAKLQGLTNSDTPCSACAGLVGPSVGQQLGGVGSEDARSAKSRQVAGSAAGTGLGIRSRAAPRVPFFPSRRCENGRLANIHGTPVAPRGRKRPLLGLSPVAGEVSIA